MAIGELMKSNHTIEHLNLSGNTVKDWCRIIWNQNLLGSKPKFIGQNLLGSKPTQSGPMVEVPS